MSHIDRSQTVPDQVDIVIIGGGMVGLTLACALGGSGLSVVVIDPCTSPFSDLARSSPNGCFVQGTAGALVPAIAAACATI